MFRLIKSTFFTLFLSSFVFLTAHAQTNELTLQVSPQSPRPNSTVTIQTLAVGMNIDSATFAWYINGKSFKKGKGMTSIEIPSGKAGVPVRVSVEISSPQMGLVTERITFTPTDVSLMWESDGYTPPFYKGKALESYGSKFKVVAVPEFFTSAGKRIDPKTLIYTWKKNGKADPDQSGYGKDSYSGEQESFVRGEDEITVLVSTQSDDMSSSKSISLSPGIPDIVLYENNPLIGILYEQALPNRFNLLVEEMTIRAEPYDFSLAKITLPLINYEWAVNGVQNSNFSNKNEITVRKAGGGGQSTIDLNLQHQEKLLQGGQIGVTILQ